MATVTDMTGAITEITASTLNNGTTDMSLLCTYPTFDVIFDNSYLVDLYVQPLVEIPSGETVEIKIDSVSKGVFTFASNTKSFWLSELMGVTRDILSSKITETIEFVFVTNKLLQFKLISAQTGYFLNSEIIRTSGLSSQMYLLEETYINASDQNAVLAIRDAMDKSKTEITGNGTNVITIKNSFPVFGLAIPHTFVIENLITFDKTLPMGTEIVIKKDGIAIKTVVTDRNITNIYLSDLLGVSRELLYTKISETYEFDFVYNQTINNKVITGEVPSFVGANVTANELPQGIFLLADSKTLNLTPLVVNECSFVKYYDNQGGTLKKAVLELGNDQNINVEFATDNSVTPPKEYIRIMNKDEAFNIDVSLIMDLAGLKNYITLLQDMGRILIQQ